MAEMTKKTTAAAKTSKPATKSAKPAKLAGSATKAPAKKVPAVAVAKKPAAKKPVAAKTKAPAAKKIAAPAVVPAAPKPAMRVSDEQRYRMVAEAAYYRAESNQFKSDPVRDWIEAESDITILLSGGN
jgi:hypothetical protein